MSRLKLIKKLCLLLPLFLFVVAFNSATMQQNKVEKFVASSGYAIKSKTEIDPSEWEKSQYNLQGKKRFAIKSIKPVPKNRGHYFRFLIDEEKYLNQTDAIARLNKLYELPPGVESKAEPNYVLRKGFRQGNLVYIVSTDAVMFEEEMQRFVIKLEKTIKGN